MVWLTQYLLINSAVFVFIVEEINGTYDIVSCYEGKDICSIGEICGINSSWETKYHFSLFRTLFKFFIGGYPATVRTIVLIISWFYFFLLLLPQVKR